MSTFENLFLSLNSGVVTTDLDQAVFLNWKGEAKNVITVYPTNQGKNWSDCMSAINAVTDLFFNEHYNMEESEVGLHVYASKSLHSRFSGHAGYIHVTHPGIPGVLVPPTIEEFPLGWARIDVDRVTGALSLSHQPDVRTDAEKAAANPEYGKLDPTEVVASRKHEWVDALLTGGTLRIRIAAIRRYVADRLESLGLPTLEERQQDARAEIIERRRFINNVLPVMKEVAVEQEQNPLPLKDNGTPEVKSLVIATISGGKVDLATIPDRFYPVVYDAKRNSIVSTETAWDPTNARSIGIFARWAEEGKRLGNLPA